MKEDLEGGQYEQIGGVSDELELGGGHFELASELDTLNEGGGNNPFHVDENLIKSVAYEKLSFSTGNLGFIFSRSK